MAQLQVTLSTRKAMLVFLLGFVAASLLWWSSCSPSVPGVRSSAGSAGLSIRSQPEQGQRTRVPLTTPAANSAAGPISPSPSPLVPTTQPPSPASEPGGLPTPLPWMQRLASVAQQSSKSTAAGALPSRRLIFSAATTWTGSAVLSGALDALQGVSCFFDRTPTVAEAGSSAAAWGLGPTAATRSRKLLSILSELQRRPFVNTSDTPREGSEAGVPLFSVHTAAQAGWRQVGTLSGEAASATHWVPLTATPAAPVPGVNRSVGPPPTVPEEFVFAGHEHPGKSTWNKAVLERGSSRTGDAYCDTTPDFLPVWSDVVLPYLVGPSSHQDYFSVSLVRLRQNAAEALRSLTAHRNLGMQPLPTKWEGGPFPASWRTLSITSSVQSGDSLDMLLSWALDVDVRARWVRRLYPRLYMPEVWLSSEGSLSGIAALQRALHIGAQLQDPAGAPASVPLVAEVNNLGAVPDEFWEFRLQRFIWNMQDTYGAQAMPVWLDVLSAADADACRQAAAEDLALPLETRRLPSLLGKLPRYSGNSTLAASECLAPSFLHAGQALPWHPGVGAPPPPALAAAMQAPPPTLDSVFSCRYTQCMVGRAEAWYRQDVADAKLSAAWPKLACVRLPEGAVAPPDALRPVIDWVESVLVSSIPGTYVLDDVQSTKRWHDAVKNGRPGATQEAEAAQEDNLRGAARAGEAMRQLCQQLVPWGREAANAAVQYNGGILHTRTGAPMLVEGFEGVDWAAVTRSVLAAAGVVSGNGRRLPLPTEVPLSRGLVKLLASLCRESAWPLCLRTYVTSTAAP